MFFVLSKLLDAFLSPYSWGLVLLALAIPWRGPASWKRKRAFGIAALTLLVVFSLEPIANGLAYRLESQAISTYRKDEVYDAVILLGGVGDERVYFETGEGAFNDNVERLIATHRLLADGRARFAIVSGGPEQPALAEWSEARLLGGQLTSWGVDPSRIILENEAKNTHENAVFSKRIAVERGFRKVLVVTSAFHMRRSRECFAAVEMDVDSLAVDYRAHGSKSPGSDTWVPRASFLGQSVKVLREMAGLYIYRLQGYAKPVL